MHKSRFWTNSWLSIDDSILQCAINKCDRPPCSLSHRRRRINESMFITAYSMHRLHDHESTTSRREQNLFVRSSKSEADLGKCARRRPTRLLKLTPDSTKHRAASLRQQGYLLPAIARGCSPGNYGIKVGLKN